MIPDGYRGIVYIMRGCPGSGKSHDAKILVGGKLTHIFSTDDWFEQQPGGYRANWSVDKLFRAHKWNENRTRAAMQRGVTPIVVDNTNMSYRDARPYIEMAAQYQYLPEVKESTSPWWIKIAELLKDKVQFAAELEEWAEKLSSGFVHEGKEIKNVHGVPVFAISKMFRKYHPWTIEAPQ
jgi:hypothetical protein